MAANQDGSPLVDGRTPIWVADGIFMPDHNKIVRFITAQFSLQTCDEGYSWRHVTEYQRNWYWEEFTKKYRWEDHLEATIREIWYKNTAAQYRCTIHAWRSADRHPPTVSEERWASWTQMWNEGKWLANAAKNKDNRNNEPAGPGTGTTKHIAGSKTYSGHTQKLREKHGRDPTSWELYIHTHRHDDGSFVDERSRLVDKLEVAEFSGLRSSGCVTFSKNNRDTSFFDVVAAQFTPKTAPGSIPVNGKTVAKLKVAINGFGRIGRNFLRCWHGRKNSPLEVVVVNDSGGVKNASHLLKYDSILGTFKADVKIVDKETISVDGKPIKVVSSRDPLQLPWAELGIDIVIEGTGVFVDGPGAGKHIQAGAKKVLITAPAKGADIPTYVVGVNEQDYYHEVANIISNASCTTNCLAPFVKVMDEEFGIVKGTMTTTHSYTGDQRLLDASHRDLRRARAAALNIVPTSTGAAKAVSLVLPQLKGKLNGIALRVPTPNVSVVDLVVNVEKKGLSAESVNAAFRKAAEGPLTGVLDVCDAPLVSVDFRCSDVSSTIDSSLTMVMGDDMVKVVAWYDNEWGYSQRVVDLAHLVANKWPGASVQGGGDPLEEFCKTNPADEECKVYEA